MKIIDISLPVHPGMVIYPRNPRVSFRWVRTPHSWLTQAALGTHSGTHIDVPRHVFKNGWGVDKTPLEKLVGSCRVLDLTHVKDAIRTKDLLLYRIKRGERILAKTRNSRLGLKKFHRNYVYCDGDAAEYLAKKKIALFGTDYLSVKQWGNADNRPHTALLAAGIPIFEGLFLRKVKPGNYFFVGLPLKLMGRDGAPARVILLKN